MGSEMCIRDRQEPAPGFKNDYLLIINTYSSNAPCSNAIINSVQNWLNTDNTTAVYVEHLNTLLIDSQEEFGEVSEAFQKGTVGSSTMPQKINPKLKIEGILLTMTDSRTNYGKQIDTLIRQAYGSKIKVFDQTIPRSVRAAEISAVGKSIFQHDPKGKVAEAYKSLTKEVVANAERQLKRVAERGR